MQLAEQVREIDTDQSSVAPDARVAHQLTVKVHGAWTDLDVEGTWIRILFHDLSPKGAGRGVEEHAAKISCAHQLRPQGCLDQLPLTRLAFPHEAHDHLDELRSAT